MSLDAKKVLVDWANEQQNSPQLKEHCTKSLNPILQVLTLGELYMRVTFLPLEEIHKFISFPFEILCGPLENYWICRIAK